MNIALSEEHYGGLPTPVWVVGAESQTILDANDAACDLYGYSKDDLLGSHIGDLVEAWGQGEVVGTIHLQRREHRRQNGSVFIAECCSIPVHVQGSSAFLVFVTDVTTQEQKRCEDALKLEQYQALAEAAHDLQWDWDLTTNSITYSDALVTQLGYARNEIREDIDWWASLIHPDDYETSSWSVPEGERDARSYWSAEYRIKRADGSYVPVLDRGIVLTDEKRNPIRMIGTIVDLSTRQSAEDERKQLFRLSQDCMLMLTPQGIITQGNAAFYSLVGLDELKDKRRDMRGFLSEEDRPLFEEAVERALSDGDESHFTTSIGLDRGHGKSVHWAMVANEARTRLFLTGRDITETLQAREKLEEALARSQELAVQAQAANKAQTEFLQNMSHELRTPMNGLLGTAQLLAGSASTAKQKELARILIQSGEALLQILNDILDFSKIEAGEVALDRAPFHPSEVVDSVLALFQLTAVQKGLELTAEVPPSANVLVVGDQFRIRQIVNNLVGNAIKFTDQGTIHLAVEARAIGTRRVELCLSVSDSGIGIDPSMHERIFDRFIQADSSLTRRHGGTGLGLSIVRTLVELMGGTITVASELGKGSEFLVRIPFMMAGNAGIPNVVASIKKARAREGTRVLIAEDVEVNAIILANWLEDRGFECQIASTGSETMSCLNDTSFDGLFLDLHIPDYSGYEIVTMLRESEQGTDNHLPVIAVTASVSVEERNRCFDLGFDDYIPKPVMVADLDRVVSRLFVD